MARYGADHRPGGDGPSYERVAVENALRGYSKTAPRWLSVLLMAEQWGVHPETIMQMPRGAVWAARWGVVQGVRARIQRQDGPVPLPLDDEPEWVTLERQMKAQP